MLKFLKTNCFSLSVRNGFVLCSRMKMSVIWVKQFLLSFLSLLVLQFQKQGGWFLSSLKLEIQMFSFLHALSLYFSGSCRSLFGKTYRHPSVKTSSSISNVNNYKNTFTSFMSVPQATLYSQYCLTGVFIFSENFQLPRSCGDEIFYQFL